MKKTAVRNPRASGYNKGIKAAKKVAAREASEKRAAAWQALSPEQQLAALDKWHGKGLGAKKQRARLANVS